MHDLPTVTISYFLAAVATLVVGIRSTQNYRKIHSALSRHFAISGFLASFGLFLYSIPFIFVSSPEVLKICILIGRIALDVVAIWQVYLIWYLTGLKKYPLRYFVVPLVIIGILGYFAQAGFLVEAQVSQSGNVTFYTFGPLAVYTHAFCLAVVFVAGLILARQAMLQKQLRAKIRLMSIAILYTFAAAADMYNSVFLRGTNNSWVVMVGFLIAAGVFLLTTIIFSRKPNKN